MLLKENIGLEVEDNSIKLVQLKRCRSKIYLSNWGKLNLPSKVMQGGIVHDSVELGKALELLFEKTRINRPNVITAISGQQAFIRHFNLPLMTWEEMTEAIKYQVQKFLPIPLEEAVIDFMVPGGKYQLKDNLFEVVVVATRSSVVKGLAESIRKTGARPVALEIEPLALYRLNNARKNFNFATQIFKSYQFTMKKVAKILSGFSEYPSERNLVSQNIALIVNIKESMIQLSLFEGELLRLNRTVLLPLDLTESMSIIDKWLFPSPPLNLAISYSNKVLEEVWAFLEYYHLENPDRQVDQIFLTGEGMVFCDISVLQNKIEIPVRLLNPLTEIAVDDLPEGKLKELSCGYGVAIGLALRGLNYL